MRCLILNLNIVERCCPTGTGRAEGLLLFSRICALSNPILTQAELKSHLYHLLLLIIGAISNGMSLSNTQAFLELTRFSVHYYAGWEEDSDEQTKRGRGLRR